jgi:hypothetical protein
MTLNKIEPHMLTFEPALKTEIVAFNTGLAGTVKLNGTGQVTYGNLAQDAREQMTGGNTAVVGVDAVGTVNIVNKSVTQAKAGFKYLTGVIKQGTLNIDTVAHTITATGNAGVYVEGMNKYYIYATTQTIPVPSTTGLFAIYFNYVTKLYEAYTNSQALIGPQDLVFITTWPQIKVYRFSTRWGFVGKRVMVASGMSFLIAGAWRCKTWLCERFKYPHISNDIICLCTAIKKREYTLDENERIRIQYNDVAQEVFDALSDSAMVHWQLP